MKLPSGPLSMFAARADIAFYMAQLVGERWGMPVTDAHRKLPPFLERMD